MYCRSFPAVYCWRPSFISWNEEVFFFLQGLRAICSIFHGSFPQWNSVLPLYSISVVCKPSQMIYTPMSGLVCYCTNCLNMFFKSVFVIACNKKKSAYLCSPLVPHLPCISSLWLCLELWWLPHKPAGSTAEFCNSIWMYRCISQDQSSVCVAINIPLFGAIVVVFCSTHVWFLFF